MNTTTSESCGRYPYRPERAALRNRSYVIDQAGADGSALSRSSVDHLVLFDAARAVRRGQALLLRGDRVQAQRVLTTMALCYRRYAELCEAAGEARYAAPFGVAATQLTEALAILGGEPPADYCGPTFPSVEPKASSGCPTVLAEYQLEVGDDVCAHVRAETRVSAGGSLSLFPSSRVQACVNAPDPMRTQVTFDRVTDSRDEAFALARRWASFGAALVHAAVEVSGVTAAHTRTRGAHQSSRVWKSHLRDGFSLEGFCP